jgi:hypothetical protein
MGANSAPNISPPQPTVDVEAQNAKRNDKLQYIANIELYDFKAAYMDSVLQKHLPGVEFKLKNKGTKTIKEIKVTVYFKDKDGNVIHEENFYPVHAASFKPSGPLKAGYIWQMERGHFYTAKNVPSEWKQGNAVASVTDLEIDE